MDNLKVLFARYIILMEFIFNFSDQPRNTKNERERKLKLSQLAQWTSMLKLTHFIKKKVKILLSKMAVSHFVLFD